MMKPHSKNKGKFLEEISFLAKYLQPLKDWIEKHPQNVSYLSHVSQNEMLDICSNLITNAICEQIHTSKYFSIKCDEVTSHKKAFISIILRFVTDFQIQERCLKLVPVSSLTGRSLADVILSVLSDHNLPLMDLIGKDFDGAANMSGKDEGVQLHLFEAGAQLSVYFHCFAHRLNLVLEHSVENVTTVKTVFDAIGDIYRFMDGSLKRHALCKEHVKKSKKLLPEKLHFTHCLIQGGRLAQTILTLLSMFIWRFCQCSNRCQTRVMGRLQVYCSVLNNSILFLLVLSFRSAII